MTQSGWQDHCAKATLVKIRRNSRFPLIAHQRDYWPIRHQFGAEIGENGARAWVLTRSDVGLGLWGHASRFLIRRTVARTQHANSP